MIQTEVVEDSEYHKCPSCCAKTCQTVEYEYGGLAEGGDYAKHVCETCNKIAWVMLPD